MSYEKFESNKKVKEGFLSQNLYMGQQRPQSKLALVGAKSSQSVVLCRPILEALPGKKTRDSQMLPSVIIIKFTPHNLFINTL